MIIKYFIILIFLNFIYSQDCNYNICGGYKIKTFCNYLWMSTYVDCMSFINNNNTVINNCLKKYGWQVRYEYNLENNILNSFIECNINDQKNKNETIKQDYNTTFSISNCINNEYINNKKEIHIKNSNITCDFRIYQIK